MAVSHPRNRIVYFRISEDEFHQLVALCNETGTCRSVSELSREAVRQLILNGRGGADGSNSIQESLRRVDQNIVALNDQIGQLVEFLRAAQEHPAAGTPAVERAFSKPTGKRNGHP
jgi:hypothetical protein